MWTGELRLTYDETHHKCARQRRKCCCWRRRYAGRSAKNYSSKLLSVRLFVLLYYSVNNGIAALRTQYFPPLLKFRPFRNLIYMNLHCNGVILLLNVQTFLYIGGRLRKPFCGKKNTVVTTMINGQSMLRKMQSKMEMHFPLVSLLVYSICHFYRYSCFFFAIRRVRQPICEKI